MQENEAAGAGGHLQSVIFRRLVSANLIKNLTLSVTGIIDTVIVGRFLGQDGLSAMRLAMPVFFIFSLFSLVMSSGLTVLLTRELAYGKIDQLNRSFRSVLSAGVVISALFMLIGITAPQLVTRVLAGNISDPAVLSYTTDYIRVILAGALVMILYDILGSVALLEGAERKMFYASAAILIADIAGDLLAVVTGTGMTGIAAASAAAYLCACVVIMTHFRRGSSMFSLGLRLPDIASVRKSFLLGMPMGVSCLCNIVWPVAFNYLIIICGTIDGLAALSVQDAVHYIPEALVMGIGSATLILTGIFSSELDSGSLKRERSDILRWSLLGCSAVTLAMIAAAPAIVTLFVEDEQVRVLGIMALRLYLIGVPFCAVNYAAISYLQGMGRELASSCYLLINHLVLPLVLGCVLGRLYGQTGIFAAFPACEIVMAVILAALIIVMKLRGRWSAVDGDSKDIVSELRRSIGSTEDAVSASEELDRMCLTNGVDAARAKHLALCAEELAVNSIQHGFGDGRKHHLELRALITEDELILRLRDDCRKFDLTERYKMINPDDPAANIGIRLVYASADDVSYSSAMHLNNVCIRIAL